MNNLGTLLYTSTKGYKLYGLMTRDVSSTRVSGELYTISPKGEMSDLITVRKKDTFTKKDFMDFLLDYAGDFTRDDIDKISVKVKELFAGNDITEIQGKQTLNEMLCTIRNQIRKISKDSDNSLFQDVFIENNAGYIKTKAFSDFCRQCEDLDFKRLEVLKRLKIMGALKPGVNRTYDTSKKIKGNVCKVYCISLEEEK